jgi:hypothetical protein
LPRSVPSDADLFTLKPAADRLVQMLDLFWEHRWRNVYAGELEVRHQMRPPLWPTGGHAGASPMSPHVQFAMPRRCRPFDGSVRVPLQVLRLSFPNAIDREAPACEGGSTLTHVV